VRVFSEVLGEYVEIPDQVERVVSLDPASTEALFMMGLEDRIVGTDAFSYRPPQARAKRKVGSYTHVDFRLLSQLNPQLVFVTTGVQRELMKSLKEKGFRVYPIPVATSVAKIMDNILILGHVMGAREEARELQLRILDSLCELRGSLGGVRVYVQFDLGGPITPGFPTHVSDALRILGALNVFDDSPEAYFTPSLLEVERRDPDVIVLEPKRADPDAASKFRDSAVRAGAPLLASKIVKVTQGDFLAHMGPSFVLEGVKWLRDALVKSSA
jgi:iron complex transport system substrate-binding protein